MRGCLMNYAGKAKRHSLVEELYARNTDTDSSKEEMYYLSVLRACRQVRAALSCSSVFFSSLTLKRVAVFRIVSTTHGRNMSRHRSSVEQ